MRNTIQFISTIFLLFLIGCSIIDKENSVKVETRLDSILYNSFKEYRLYLDNNINEFGGDKKYSILVTKSISSDTLSFLFTCNESNDLSSIITDTLTNVYKIDNHFIFSKSQLFSNYTKINFEEVALRINKVAYKNYKQKGIKPFPEVLWDCAFLYLVIKDNEILRHEIRYFDTEPKMWKNNF